MNHTYATAAADTQDAVLQRACDCGGGSCETCQDETSEIQPKLTIGAPNDVYEQEADRVADQVISSPMPPIPAPIATTPFVQRMETDTEEEEAVQLKPVNLKRMESEVEENEETLQTKTESLQKMEGAEEEEELQLKSLSTSPQPALSARSATTNAAAAVSSGGTPLTPSDRAYFEPRFGHDLSHVRLHTDSNAGQAARSINARAYTLRHNIAFAPGQFSPTTTEGRRLLAHELMHTLQQENQSRPHLQRRSFFAQVAGLFHGDDFSDADLRTYLEHLKSGGQIEDFTDSDNKARAVSLRLADGDELFGLQDTGSLRFLLIKEMLSGFAGNDDERAILSLLESAMPVQLNEIFGTHGLRPETLEDKFQGAERLRLDRFFTTRFRGGRSAITAGQIEPVSRSSRTGPFSVERARTRLREVEQLLAEALEIERERDRNAMLRRMMDEQSSDPASALGLKAREERRLSANMNQMPLDIRMAGTRIEFRVRFHIRFEDPAMNGRAGELTTSLRDGIRQVWNTEFDSGALQGRSFEMIPEIVQVAADASRDRRYWLLSVRPTNTGPAAYPDCELPELVEGVPTSVTDTLCDGGLISISPNHITRAGILGHETLHLFGLVDRYMGLTSTTEQGVVQNHQNVATRQTGGRPDPLGSQSGTILAEDLSFVLDNQGVYDREISRRLGAHSVVSLTIEANQLRESIRQGRETRSLIRPRENFNDELFRSADDL